MRIDHVAIYTPALEKSRQFYCQYFGFTSGEKYINPNRGFESYFLSGKDGTRLELMFLPGLEGSEKRNMWGLAHIAIGVGSEGKVIALTQELVTDGYNLVSAPRRTGDGYFESVIEDPDGNFVEITV